MFGDMVRKEPKDNQYSSGSRACDNTSNKLGIRCHPSLPGASCHIAGTAHTFTKTKLADTDYSWLNRQKQKHAEEKRKHSANSNYLLPPFS